MVMADDIFEAAAGIDYSENSANEVDGAWGIDLSQTGCPFYNMNGMKGNKAQ